METIPNRLLTGGQETVGPEATYTYNDREKNISREYWRANFRYPRDMSWEGGGGMGVGDGSGCWEAVGLWEWVLGDGGGLGVGAGSGCWETVGVWEWVLGGGEGIGVGAERR